MELEITDIGQYKCVSISGKVDWENARKLDAEVQAAIASGARHMVFDLNRVTFLCSGAIGALTYNMNRLKSNDGSFYIVSSNDYVNYIFETLRFDVVFSGLLYDSLEDFQKKVVDNPEGSTD